MKFIKPVKLASGGVQSATCQRGKPCGRPCTGKAK